MEHRREEWKEDRTWKRGVEGNGAQKREWKEDGVQKRGVEG